MIKFGRTLRNWDQEIIDSFIVAGVRHKVDKETGQVVISDQKLNTNLMENRNSIIKTIKKNANGQLGEVPQPLSLRASSGCPACT